MTVYFSQNGFIVDGLSIIHTFKNSMKYCQLSHNINLLRERERAAVV